MLWPSVHRPGWLRINGQTLPRAGPHAEPTAPGATSRRTAANLRGRTVCTLTETGISECQPTGSGERSRTMIIIGVDYHPEFQQIVFLDKDSVEVQDKRLSHPEE